MSTSQQGPGTARRPTLVMRVALWTAIGALLASALVCVVWVLFGDQDGLIGRAFLTILLLVGFAAAAIIDAAVAKKRPDWLVLASMIGWVVLLIFGAVKIWLPLEPGEDVGWRLTSTILATLLVRFAVLHADLFSKSYARNVTQLTRAVFIPTMMLLIVLVAMLVFYLAFSRLSYPDLFWRIVVALTILVAVGTTLVPLINALFAPKPEQPAPVKPPAPAARGYGAYPVPPNPQWQPPNAPGAAPNAPGAPPLPRGAAPTGYGQQRPNAAPPAPEPDAPPRPPQPAPWSQRPPEPPGQHP